MITCINVGKSFGGTRVLGGVNCQFTQGERVCLMAPSGAGKTTLINILLGLLQPDEGSVVCDKNERFACAFQEDRLAQQLDARANVRLACGAVEEQALRGAYAALGLSGEDLEKPCALLSGGQQRRVALCRAMLADADAVLLDEPFKGLDDVARAKAAQFIKDRQMGKTILCVTHDAGDAQALDAHIWRLE